MSLKLAPKFTFISIVMWAFMQVYVYFSISLFVWSDDELFLSMCRFSLSSHVLITGSNPLPSDHLFSNIVPKGKG